MINNEPVIFDTLIIGSGLAGLSAANKLAKNGSNIISTTIDKYNYVYARFHPEFYENDSRIIYKDVEVGVMHACGHDTHVAILMGVASVLTEIREEIKGTVKFIFQPAEEGAPDGEEGGAELMVK